jgi:hypothetical protein
VFVLVTHSAIMHNCEVQCPCNWQLKWGAGSIFSQGAARCVWGGGGLTMWVECGGVLLYTSQGLRGHVTGS